MSPVSAESTSHFITILEDGRPLRVHYNDCGHGEETVVMLHGSGPGATGWANFHKNVESFNQMGFRVLLIDFPGWGESDPIVNAESRSSLNARVVKGVVDGLGIPRIHLSVGKLVLMGGGTGGVSFFAPTPTEGMKQVMELYRNPTTENLNKFNNLFVYDSSSLTDDLLQLRLKSMLARQDHLKNFLQSFVLNPNQYPDVSARLPEIQKATLIIWGRQDRVMPVDGAFRLGAGIPNSEVHLFNKCGHWAQWEHANRFNSIVKDFLRA